MTTSLKEALLPTAKKFKFSFLIKDMDDEDIVEFIEEELFDCKFTKSMTFEEAKAKALSSSELSLDLDAMVSLKEQKELFDIVHRHISN